MTVTIVQRVVQAGIDSEIELPEFDGMTFVPIDQRLLIPGLLTAEEKNWLNSYHARVFRKMAPALNDEDKHWLTRATLPVH